MGLCELVERCDWFVGGKGQKVSMAMQSTCLGGAMKYTYQGLGDIAFSTRG